MRLFKKKKSGLMELLVFHFIVTYERYRPFARVTTEICAFFTKPLPDL